jgi:hypothetical protein
MGHHAGRAVGGWFLEAVIVIVIGLFAIDLVGGRFQQPWRRAGAPTGS